MRDEAIFWLVSPRVRTGRRDSCTLGDGISGDSYSPNRQPGSAKRPLNDSGFAAELSRVFFSSRLCCAIEDGADVAMLETFSQVASVVEASV